MKRVFNAIIDRLSKESGYSYNFLVDKYHETIEETGDIDMEEFAAITTEHDWNEF